MQQLDNRIFKSEIHLPSGVKEWQIPEAQVEPNLSLETFLLEPDEEQDTSYFAAADNILNLSDISISFSPYFQLLLLLV